MRQALIQEFLSGVGGGGGPGPSARNSSDIVFFSPKLILQISSGLSMVNFKENYTFRVQHFPGALTEKLSLCEYLTNMLRIFCELHCLQ